MLDFLVLGAGTPSTTLGTMIFVLLSFTILIVLLKKFAWGALMGMMEKREEKIANDLDSAENSRISAQKLEQERQVALQNSRSEAMTIVNTAKASGEQSRQNILQEARTDAEKIKQKSEEQFERQKEQAMRDMKKDIADISLDLAAKILNEELTKDAHSKLIDEYIDELGKKDETR